MELLLHLVLLLVLLLRDVLVHVDCATSHHKLSLLDALHFFFDVGQIPLEATDRPNILNEDAQEIEHVFIVLDNKILFFAIYLKAQTLH